LQENNSELRKRHDELDAGIKKLEKELAERLPCNPALDEEVEPEEQETPLPPVEEEPEEEPEEEEEEKEKEEEEEEE